jgi:uncharacterized heparinase superfamily protein
MRTVTRYARTLVHLKPRQIMTRLVRTVFRARPVSGPTPERRAPSRELSCPIAREDGWLSASQVRLLNVEREFPGTISWRPETASRLWIYTLNYFADLPQTATAERASSRAGLTTTQIESLLDSWMAGNPSCSRDTWDPYVISVRVVNWIKWILLTEQSSAPAGGGLKSRMLDSLSQQIRLLERRLEFDIVANHLFANAAALSSAGLFFGGREGDRWSGKGFRLLERELREQVLEDGGHYERSPMYHAVVLEQTLDVLNLLKVFTGSASGFAMGSADLLREKALSMLDWLWTMTHPDGETAFFNDTTLGAAPSVRSLHDYAARIGLEPEEPFLGGIQWLERSDYFRMTSDDERTVVFFDAGRIGPDYQPGHAHCDTLSFELSRDGVRLFVNSGVSTYEPGHQRELERSTASHNTVRIDGEEQSEMWGAHRVGRRADLLHAGRSGNAAFAAHDGYCFLRGRPEHARELEISDDAVTINDDLHGTGEHLVEWFFHLRPGVEPLVEGDKIVLASAGEALGHLLLPAELELSIEDGAWHPGFNVSIPNKHVRAAWSGTFPTSFRISIGWP